MRGARRIYEMPTAAFFTFYYFAFLTLQTCQSGYFPLCAPQTLHFISLLLTPQKYFHDYGNTNNLKMQILRKTNIFLLFIVCWLELVTNLCFFWFSMLLFLASWCGRKNAIFSKVAVEFVNKHKNDRKRRTKSAFGQNLVEVTGLEPAASCSQTDL